jgi:hypothetical protein
MVSAGKAQISRHPWHLGPQPIDAKFRSAASDSNADDLDCNKENLDCDKAG